MSAASDWLVDVITFTDSPTRLCGWLGIPQVAMVTTVACGLPTQVFQNVEMRMGFHVNGPIF